MISIVFLYSNDRKAIFEKTLSCMQEMPGFSNCQIILCCDGICSTRFLGIESINVIRRDKYYCWADVITAGVERCKNDVFLCLDCDRILPIDYLIKGIRQIQRKKVLYSEQLYKVKKTVTSESLRKLTQEVDLELLIKEKRLENPVADFGKNPFSGNFVMFKEDYFSLGGFDRIYQGYGFPDTDFFMNAAKNNFVFEQVSGIEIHQYHKPLVRVPVYECMNVWNGIQFCRKWNVVPCGSLEAWLNRLQHDEIDFSQCKTFDEFEEMLSTFHLGKIHLM